MRNRAIGLLFIILLASNAGVAAVCSSACSVTLGKEFEVVSSPTQVKVHSHHHPLMEVSIPAQPHSIKSQACQKTLAFGDVLKAAAPANHLCISTSSSVAVTITTPRRAAASATALAILPGSPPQYSVLRI